MDIMVHISGMLFYRNLSPENDFCIQIFAIMHFRLRSYDAGTFWKRWKMWRIGLQFTRKRHIFAGTFWKRQILKIEL